MLNISNYFKETYNHIIEDKRILVENIDKIIWITLILWILYQFIALSSIWKISFFSWSQVITDTVIIILLLFITLLWVSVWLFNQKNIGKDKNTMILLFVAYIFVWCIISAAIIFCLFKFNLMNLIWLYLIGYCLALLFRVTLFIKWYEGDMKDLYDHEVLIFTIISIFVVFWVMNTGFTKYSVKVETEWDYSTVQYFNDKYIILEDKVIHNNDDIIFYNK